MLSRLNSDKVRFAILALLTSIFPVVQLTGIHSFTSDDIAAITLAVTNLLNLAALLVPSNTGTTTTITSPSKLDSTTVVSTGPDSP